MKAIQINSAIIDAAAILLMQYGNKGLRTLDSLQLACALILRHDDCIF